MATVTSRISSTGMHCGSCSMLIDMTLGDVDGVESSKTDLASGITVVTYDDAIVTQEALIDAIRGAGYEAEPAQ